MGISINVETNASKWKKLKCNKIFFTKTDDKFDEILKFRIGEADYDFDGCWDIEIYIRDSVYQKILTNEYFIDIENNGDVVVKNKNNEKVQPFFRNEGPTIL